MPRTKKQIEEPEEVVEPIIPETDTATWMKRIESLESKLNSMQCGRPKRQLDSHVKKMIIDKVNMGVSKSRLQREHNLSLHMINSALKN